MSKTAAGDVRKNNWLDRCFSPEDTQSDAADAEETALAHEMP